MQRERLCEKRNITDSANSMDKNNNKKSLDKSDYIDLRVVIAKLWQRKWLFVKVWTATFILSCIYILPQPREYVTSLTLAPEMGSQQTGGSLSSIASSFGFDLGSMQSEDAFYPELYPDVMSTNEFLTALLYTDVKSIEGEIDTTYLCYLMKYQKKNPITFPFRWCRGMLSKMLEDDAATVTQPGARINPRRLSKNEDNIMALVRENVMCDVDTKTDIITITVKDQDPQICVTIADTACAQLQEFITQYRTKKATKDMEYYKQLMDSAKQEYDRSVKEYSRYCDAHQNIILQAYVSERDELENTMQTKLNTYNAMHTQYQAAKAKVQERTPAFTMLKSASVPIKPASPKRMIFVATMLFLAFFVTCGWIFRNDIKAQLLGTGDDTTYNNPTD